MTQENFSKACEISKRISKLKGHLDCAKCINSDSYLPREAYFNFHQTDSVLVPVVLFKTFGRMIESELQREIFELEKQFAEL